MSLKENIDANRLPQHVAIIMDGNGRWAKARNMERSAGHVEGVNTVRQITEAASELGVKYLTLYTFSTENWNRPQDEVDALMHLIVIAIERETPDLIKNNVRLTMIGDFSRMPAEAYERLCQCGRDTAHCTGLTLCLALSYSARWEITEACRQIAQKIAEDRLYEQSPKFAPAQCDSEYYVEDGVLIYKVKFTGIEDIAKELEFELS
jgi:undecaprenyl diphosphate synthase